MKVLRFVAVLFFLTSLCGDSALFKTKKIVFYPSIYLKYNFNLLKPGDIIIKKKEPKMLEWFGHCGVITKTYTVAEFPKIGVGLKNSPLSNWYNEGRFIAVLRKKNSLSSELDILHNNISSAKLKPYGFSFKNSSSFYYCSQFVWKVFHITNNSSIEITDLDSDSGLTVWPYDILFSEELLQVKLKNYSGK